MPRACKLCDTAETAFALHPEVCDACVRYDWGRWRWRQASWLGGLVGFGAALAAALVGGVGGGLASPSLAALFVAMVGAVVAWALCEVAIDRLLNRALLHAPPAEAPHERAREAEKFYYIGVLSAYQGKTRFALRMLTVAKAHGWVSWEALAVDPRLALPARRLLSRAVMPASDGPAPDPHTPSR
jgi:hypothetical protein